MAHASPTREPDERALETFLTYYGEGMSRDDSASIAGISPEDAAAWSARPEVALALARVRAIRKYDLVKLLEASATQQYVDPKPYMWLLERLSPSEFGPPQTLTPSLTVNNVQNNLVLSERQQEAIARLVAETRDAVSLDDSQ